VDEERGVWERHYRPDRVDHTQEERHAGYRDNRQANTFQGFERPLTTIAILRRKR
jgi:hypothetical protein